MKVLQFPLARITICFLFGILFAQIIKPAFLITLLFLALAIIAFIVVFFISKKTLFQKPYFGVATFFFSFFIGVFTLISHNETLNQQHYLHQISSSNKNCSAEIVVTEKLKNSVSNDRYVATVLILNNKSSYGKIVLNIRKDSVFHNIIIGNYLKVVGSFYKNRKTANPNQFDYANYLENQQIYAQVYADAQNIEVGSKIDKDFNYYAAKIRNRIITNLEKNGFNQKELGIAEALVLGQQQDISPDIVQDYQYAGAVHILSVSGLHVGFILLFVTFLLKPLPKSKRNDLIKLFIVLIALWGFGTLAGMAPSILRSVVMFSFVAVGNNLKRTINMYHTLLVSMLFILLFKPSFLFDVGFQLSYVAVFSIVWLYPILKSVWTPKNKIATYFWNIITVSLAAQIGTFPMSIYYFHQFPGLFLVTNIIVLFLTEVILAIGVVVMILAAFNVVWIWMMKLFEGSIWLLNSIIAKIASYENFIFRDIPMNSIMMFCWYLLIISIFLYFEKPTFKKIIFGLCSVILLQISYFQAKQSAETQSEFIVFNKQKNTIITERFGKKVQLYSNDSILKNAENNLTLKPYLVANFCEIEQKKPVANFYFFHNKKIMIIDNSSVTMNDENPDVLVLSGSPKLNLERFFQQCKPQVVVADASNFRSYVKLWKATCEKQKIPFHDTSEKGYYKL